MNKKQQAAIKRLEKALKAAREAGLGIIGMDSRLYAYDRQELESLGYFEGLSSQKHLAALHDADYEMLDDHGAYLDSGGW